MILNLLTTRLRPEGHLKKTKGQPAGNVDLHGPNELEEDDRWPLCLGLLQVTKLQLLRPYTWDHNPQTSLNFPRVLF